MTQHDIMARYRKAREIAARIEVYKQRRIDQLAIESGVGRCGCRLHNCFVDYDRGRPWREIDYRKARLMRRVWNDFRHTRLCDQLYTRLAEQWHLEQRNTRERAR